MDLFFGIQYCRGDQKRFYDALERENFEEAVQILENMPHANIEDPVELFDRTAVLCIGYREIVRRTGVDYLSRKTDALKAYEKIKMEPEEMMDLCEVLKNHEIETSQELDSSLDRLLELEKKLKGVENLPQI